MLLAEQQHKNVPQLGASVGRGYVLHRFLGAGGMGAVFEAVSPEGQRVAVKVLLHVDPKGSVIQERFHREITVTGGLRSPNIVQLLDGGVDSQLGIPFMVMPLMVGLDLEQLIDQVGPLHPSVAVRIIRQACNALTTAHAAGVTHRDIKPANLYLDHDAHGRICVRMFDFGIAGWAGADRRLTATGSTFGTPLYMAPEQVSDSKMADNRSDIWSLAVTLFHALTGKVPHEDEDSLAQVMVSILNGKTPSVQSYAPWIEPGLAMVIHGALIRDCESRCPTIEMWAKALEPYTYGGDELTSAMLVPVAEELRAWTAPTIQLPATWREAVPPDVTSKESADTHLHPDTRASAMRVTSTQIDPLIGQTIAERYQVLRLLGRGGMGAVYEALDGQDRIALKVLDVDNMSKSEEARKRFVREARATASIEHPNVVRVLDAGTDPLRNLPYMAMELLCGADLSDLIEERRTLPPKSMARLIRQACAGLAAAHSRGIVHRDIKPANVFLHQQPSGELVVKICDFGLAKDLSEGDRGRQATNLTRTGGMMGSPVYMSPEQAKSAKHLDLRTDVWSLGATLYETLTGECLWEGRETVGEIIVAICTEPVPAVQDRAPWVGAIMAEVVRRALQRNPDDRFQRIEDMAAGLIPLTQGTDTLTATDLQPVSAGARQEVAVRAVTMPRNTSIAGNVSRSASPPPPQSKGRSLAVAAAMLLGVTGAGGALWANLSRSSATDQAAPVVTDEGAEKVPARLVISPATAEVTVDGKATAIEDGGVDLLGEPGHSFAIVVQAGAQRVEREVVITSGGKASPSLIEVQPPAEPTSTVSASASAAASAPAPQGRTTSKWPGSAPKPTPSPRAEPTSKPKPSPGGDAGKWRNSWGND